MLSLTEMLEYTLIREGQFLVPISAFKYTMERVETLFYNVIRTAEKWVPRSEDVFMDVTRDGVYLPDTYSVKSLGFTGNQTNQLIAPIIRPISGRYWSWDKHNHILQAQVPSHYLVKCLKHYTFEKLHYLDELGMPIYDQEEFSAKLVAEPDITSLRFRSGDKVSVYEEVMSCASNEEIVRCSGSLGEVLYNTDTRMATIMLDAPVDEPIVAEYLTKYKGFRELDISTSSLINDWFAAELFCGVGSLLGQTSIEQVPVNLNSTNLSEYGRTLRQQVLERRGNEMNFFDWLP
jgi:hypothetical protein